jgi:D-alanyl-D-alanine carboxypeptidase
MKNNLGKFAFLAIVIVAILFSRFAYPSVSPSSLADVKATTGNNATVPTFIMPQAGSGGSAVSAASGEPTAATGTGAIIPSGPSVFTQAGEVPPPSLDDNASLVADLTTGNVFEATEPAKRWPTASLTKLMTATIAEDDMSPETEITITPAEFAVDPQDETTLVVGGTYTLQDLMYVLLMPSSNVAAEAIADTYGHDAFIAQMNARAAAWGMTNTYFGDPSGLSATNQSTANDFLKLAEVIYDRYPQILSITRNAQVSITEQNSGRKVSVKSINDFAGQSDFVGGKTGHTDQADGNLFSIFEYDGHPVFIVVLGTDDRFIDTQKLYAWFKANFK